jgi:hypothetical protein
VSLFAGLSFSFDNVRFAAVTMSGLKPPICEGQAGAAFGFCKRRTTVDRAIQVVMLVVSFDVQSVSGVAADAQGGGDH